MRKRSGFTILELLIAMFISGLLIGLTTSVYSLFRQSINLDQSRAEISQNGRIATDRLSRELRQALDLVTVLPQDEADTSVDQPNEIEFEDGHANDLTYKRYYLVGDVLKMDLKEYYFTYQDDLRVKWNSIGVGNVLPVNRVISTVDIAQNVSELAFYGSNVIAVELSTSDGNNQNYQMRTAIFARNL